jgi:hypothetical protein
MRLPSLLFLSFALGINAQQLGCPTSTEPACFDVINNSLCLSQNAATGTPQVLAKCVEYEMGVGMSDLPGGVKVCTAPRREEDEGDEEKKFIGKGGWGEQVKRSVLIIASFVDARDAILQV